MKRKSRSLSKTRTPSALATYRAISKKPSRELADFVALTSGLPLVAVASGGMQAVAQFAADLHIAFTGQIGKALTPLEFASMPAETRVATLLLSSSASHGDARLAVRAAAARHGPALLLTAAQNAPAAFLRIATVPVERDTFLAVHSVIGFATALLAAHSERKRWPRLLNGPEGKGFTPRERTLVLYGPGTAAVATDLETRLSELGLSAVQLADFRNFAHGRHFGLARNLDRTTVVVLSTPEWQDLAELTVRQLPASTQLVKFSTNHRWPISVIDLLLTSIRACEYAATRQSVSTRRPGVPQFGRRLYRTAVRRRIPERDPVARKLLALSPSAALEQRLRRRYERALIAWISRTNSVRVGALVLDYDGTCCETADRYSATPRPVQRELLRLLRSGLPVAFASGRGGSLHDELRRWIPKSMWNQVVVGLYNSGLRIRLSEQIPKDGVASKGIAKVARLIQKELGRVTVSTSPWQARIEPAESGVALADLEVLTSEVLVRDGALFRVVRSGHSIDVVPHDTTKARVVWEMGKQTSMPVLAIGDQGQRGGNDFDLLASTPFSLSVDSCSADPTRCWNLSRSTETGPTALVRYLESIRPLRVGARISIR